MLDYFLYFTQKQLLLSHPQMAANTLALREENDEKLFHLLAAARDLMKTFKKVLQGDGTSQKDDIHIFQAILNSNSGLYCLINVYLGAKIQIGK